MIGILVSAMVKRERAAQAEIQRRAGGTISMDCCSIGCEKSMVIISFDVSINCFWWYNRYVSSSVDEKTFTRFGVRNEETVGG